MIQTQRTLADVLALLADNSSGDISPEDVRDIVASVRIAKGSIYLVTPIETVISAPSTWVKALGTTSLVSTYSPRDFTMPQDNRLEYTGTAKRHVMVNCSISSDSASGAPDLLGFRLAFNGVTDPETEIERLVGTGDIGAIPLIGEFEMVSTDYVEIWVANLTDDSNFTLTNFRMRVEGEALES